MNHKVDVKELKDLLSGVLNYCADKRDDDFVGVRLQVKELQYLVRLLNGKEQLL